MLGPTDLAVRVSGLGDLEAPVRSHTTVSRIYASGKGTASAEVTLGLMSPVVLVNFLKDGNKDVFM